MKTAIMVLLAVTAAASLYACRSAKVGLQTATADQLTLSKKLSDITAKLAEKEAAIETLQIKLRLQAEGSATLSNLVHDARLDLTNVALRLQRQTETVRLRDDEIASLKKDGAGLSETAERQREQAEILRRELSAVRSDLANARRELIELGRSRNSSEAALARMTDQWNDPSRLRAQLETLGEQPPGRVPKGRPLLLIQPDGSVVTLSDTKSR